MKVDDEEVQPDGMQGKRPGCFTLLIVVSLIGSGLSAISYFCMSIWKDYFYDALKYNPVYGQIEGFEEMLEMLYGQSVWYYLLTALVYALSFAGVIFMTRRKRIGFHFYTLAQLSLLIIPMIFMKAVKVSFLSLFVTLLMIGLYAYFMGILPRKKEPMPPYTGTDEE